MAKPTKNTTARPRRTTSLLNEMTDELMAHGKTKKFYTLISILADRAAARAARKAHAAFMKGAKDLKWI